jgi:outer membrane protein TolC
VGKKAIEVRQNDLLLKEELYKQAKELVNQGLKTQADALSIQSALYLAQENLAVSKADLDKVLKTLSLYMKEEIDPQSIFENTLLNSHGDPNRDLLLKNAQEQNFALKSYLEEIEKNSMLYNASKAQNYGSIDAVAAYSHQDNINEYDTSLIGITYKVPLYSGGRIDAQTQQNRIAKEMAKESYNAKKLLVEEEIETLLIDLQRYKYTLRAKESLIDSSNATKEIVEARYKEGLSTYVEILDAASVNLYAKLGLIEAKFAINKIINRLEYLQGETK